MLPQPTLTINNSKYNNHLPTITTTPAPSPTPQPLPGNPEVSLSRRQRIKALRLRLSELNNNKQVPFHQHHYPTFPSPRSSSMSMIQPIRRATRQRSAPTILDKSSSEPQPPSTMRPARADALNPSPRTHALLSSAELFKTLSTKNSPFLKISENSSYLHQLQAQVITTMKNVWAQSTWNNRISLVQRLEEFRVNNNLHLDESDLALDWSILLFVQSTNTTPQSKLTYVKSLAATYRRQQHELPLCSLLASALRPVALVPMHQAVPISEQQVDLLLSRAETENLHLMLAVFLMFKTASRFDDVARLTKESFVLNTPSEIIVEWMANTKTTRMDPWRTSAWTVIQHHAPMNHYNEIIQSLPATADPLLDSTTAQFVAWVQQDQQTSKITAQSIKRGSLTLLSQMVLKQELDISLIPRMAKHKVEFDVFPATTLRYLSDRITLARMLRTQEATRLLKCIPHPPQDNSNSNPLLFQESPPATPTQQNMMMMMPPPPQQQVPRSSSNPTLSTAHRPPPPNRLVKKKQPPKVRSQIASKLPTSAPPAATPAPMPALDRQAPSSIMGRVRNRRLLKNQQQQPQAREPSVTLEEL